MADSDRLEFIQELLQETRDEQRKGNAMLGELRVEVATLQRSYTSQEANIASLRSSAERTADRLHEVELQIQRLPQATDLSELERRHSELEGRVRVLEGDGREAKVVNRGASAVVREIMRYVIAALGALLLGALAWAVKHGWTPG